MGHLTFATASPRSYTMYHGTTLSNARQIVRNGFIPSSGGMLGPGVYVSRSFQKACAYPQVLPPGEERVVLKIRVRVGKVKRIDYNGHPLQYTWHQHGYDTAWVPPMCGMVPSGLEEDCVWDPKRIEVLAVLDKYGNSMMQEFVDQPGSSIPTLTYGYPSATYVSTSYGRPYITTAVPQSGTPYITTAVPQSGTPYITTAVPQSGTPYITTAVPQSGTPYSVIIYV